MSGGGIREIRIQSLGEFVNCVTPERPDPATGRRRDDGIYHGSPFNDAPLLTSLDRLGGTNPPHTKADLEEHVLRNFIRYARPHLGNAPVNEWEQLVSAQHHGVPTRLLDWTYSPLVAAFFATRPDRSAKQHDRAIWRLDWKQVHRRFKLPSLALPISDLDALFGNDSHFRPWTLFCRPESEQPFAAVIEPPSLNARIVAQAAVFTLCSVKHQSFDEFLVQHGLHSAMTKYVIDAGDVSLIRDQLDLVGVDERRLFPDLDGVAAAIRRYYG
jgi:hypothetical protein